MDKRVRHAYLLAQASGREFDEAEQENIDQENRRHAEALETIRAGFARARGMHINCDLDGCFRQIHLVRQRRVLRAEPSTGQAIGWRRRMC